MRGAVRTSERGRCVAVKILLAGAAFNVRGARRLAVQPKCLIVDEPTRGVDVGTKAEIYALFDELARAGIPT